MTAHPPQSPRPEPQPARTVLAGLLAIAAIIAADAGAWLTDPSAEFTLWLAIMSVTTVLLIAVYVLQRLGVGKRLVARCLSLVSKWPAGPAARRHKSADLLRLLRQLAFLLQRRVPLVEALNIICQAEPQLQVGRLGEDLRLRVQRGEPLSSALAPHRRIVGDYGIALIRFGEEHDCLAEVLGLLCREQQRDGDLRAMFKAALTYPAIMGLTSIGVVFFLLVFVIPVFVKMFADVGMVLPLPTQVVIAASNWLMAYCALIVPPAAAAAWVIVLALRLPLGERLLCRVPWLGRCWQVVREVRTAGAILTAVRCRIPLVEALTRLADGMQAFAFRQELLLAVERLQRGSSVSEAFAGRPLLSPLMQWAIATGEASGTLTENLERMLQLREEHARQAMTLLVSVVEPTLIVGFGMVVGLIVMAMFMPFFALSSMVPL